MQIRSKLLIGNVLVLALLASLALVSVVLIQQIQSNLAHLSKVADPLERVVLELEINAVETDQAVEEYILDQNEDNLDLITDSEGDFERYASQFLVLAETEEVLSLGRRVITIYREFTTKGLEITLLVQHRIANIRQFRKLAEELDTLLDDQLQANINRSLADAALKVESALEMEVNVEEAIGAYEAYFLVPDVNLIKRVADAVEDFKRFYSQFRRTRPNAEEEESLVKVNLVFAELMTVGQLITINTDVIIERTKNFNMLHANIDRILDDEIQPLILLNKQRATADAVNSSQLALSAIIGMGALILVITLFVNSQVSKGIIGGADQLTKGVEEVSGGNLDFQIDSSTDDEFGVIAKHFNIMAEKRKQAEKQLSLVTNEAVKANKAKSEFLASMSHDLRTPLNAIMGFSDMMRVKTFGPLGNEHYEQYVDDIHGSGALLISLINDVLDLSKIEAGKYELVNESLDISSMIKSSIRQLKTAAETNNQSITLDIPSDMPALLGDERAMIQILNNLLSNAIKFTPDSGEVSIVAKMNKSNRILLSVTDTGIGMSNDGIAKALKPFEQADGTHSRRHEGTGLGVHICVNMMELFGGTLEIESEIDTGTTVTLQFPPERTIQPL
jgi:signal transduction histidine kinase